MGSKTDRREWGRTEGPSLTCTSTTAISYKIILGKKKSFYVSLFHKCRERTSSKKKDFEGLCLYRTAVYEYFHQTNALRPSLQTVAVVYKQCSRGKMGMTYVPQQQTHNLNVLAVWSGTMSTDVAYLGCETTRAQGFRRSLSFILRVFLISSSPAALKRVVRVLGWGWRRGRDFVLVSEAPALGTPCERCQNRTKQSKTSRLKISNTSVQYSKDRNSCKNPRWPKFQNFK